MMFRLLCIVNLSLINAFNLWDYCIESTINCELNDVRYTYGSAYNPNNSKWYLVGGTFAPIQSLPYVQEITLPSYPSINGYACDIYSKQLPQNYSQNEAAIFNNILYSFDGFGDNLKYLNNVYKSNTISETQFNNSYPQIPISMAAACSVIANNKIYIIGGGTLGDALLNTMYEYDVILDEWKTLTPMSIERFAPACTYFNGNIYVFGGASANWTKESDVIGIYNINLDKWSTSKTRMSYGAHWLSSSLLNIPGINRNLILIFGGVHQTNEPIEAKNNIDVYDIDNDEIIQKTEMLNRRYAFKSITPYSNNNNWNGNVILFAGGKSIEKGGFKDIEAIYCNNTNNTL